MEKTDEILVDNLPRKDLFFSRDILHFILFYHTDE